MLRRRIEQLLDAVGAVRRRPVRADEVRIARRCDAVVGGDDGAAGRVEAARQLLERNGARPIVFLLPARRRRHALQVVGGAAHRHAAGGDEADVAVDVGVDDVLLRRMEIARRGEEAVPFARAREFQRRLHAAVVLGERGPREGDDVAARRVVLRRFRDVGDHRAVSRDAHAQLLGLAALHADGFLDDAERARAFGREVAAGSVQLFDVEVLHVGAGVRKAPGDALVVPDDYARHAGQRRADDVDAGRGDLREVPHRWRGEAEVRIVGEQRLAAFRARTRHHPVVRAQAFVVWHELREAHRVALHRRVQLLQVGDRRRRLARIRRQEFVDARERERFREAHAQQFVAPVAAQVPGHHFDPGDRVGRHPGFGPRAGEPEFNRQHRV